MLRVGIEGAALRLLVHSLPTDLYNQIYYQITDYWGEYHSFILCYFYIMSLYTWLVKKYIFCFLDAEFLVGKYCFATCMTSEHIPAANTTMITPDSPTGNVKQESAEGNRINLLLQWYVLLHPVSYNTLSHCVSTWAGQEPGRRANKF